MAAYLDRVDLSAHGFYATPDITGFGGDRPFNYLCYGLWHQFVAPFLGNIGCLYTRIGWLPGHAGLQTSGWEVHGCRCTPLLPLPTQGTRFTLCLPVSLCAGTVQVRQ